MCWSADAGTHPVERLEEMLPAHGQARAAGWRLFLSRRAPVGPKVRAGAVLPIITDPAHPRSRSIETFGKIPNRIQEMRLRRTGKEHTQDVHRCTHTVGTLGAVFSQPRIVEGVFSGPAHNSPAKLWRGREEDRLLIQRGRPYLRCGGSPHRSAGRASAAYRRHTGDQPGSDIALRLGPTAAPVSACSPLTPGN